MVMIFLEIKFYFYFFALTYFNTFMINKLRMYKIKKLKIVLLFFICFLYSNASQNYATYFFDFGDPSEMIKDFDKITLDDAAEAYLVAANNECSKIKSRKNPKKKSADYYKWMAESLKMHILEKLKNLATAFQEQEKKQLFEKIKECIECYENAYLKYKEQKKMKINYLCGCNLGCDFCIVGKTIDEKDINYAKAMEMNAKKKDIFNLLNKNGLLLDFSKYANLIIENNFENKWSYVANTKPSYHKYALAKQKEIDYYITNCTDEKLDEVISAWRDVLIDKELIKSFGGENSVFWEAYKSFVERKIKTFECLKTKEKNFYESLKEVYENNFNKDLEVYSEIKDPVYKAFAYEAAALYNSREFFEGFYRLPIQENLNL